MQVTKNVKAFVNKASGITELQGWIEELKVCIVMQDEIKALMAEGLMVLAMAGSLPEVEASKISRQNKDILRSQLSAIAGNQVKESLVQPVLLDTARKCIG